MAAANRSPNPNSATKIASWATISANATSTNKRSRGARRASLAPVVKVIVPRGNLRWRHDGTRSLPAPDGCSFDRGQLREPVRVREDVELGDPATADRERDDGERPALPSDDEARGAVHERVPRSGGQLPEPQRCP